jgi:predicted transcriptional regulator
MDMPTQQFLIRLPEELAARLKAVVPARQRNKFVTELVATAVAHYEAKLAKIADAVTNEEKRNPKMVQETRDWEATIGNGIEEENRTHEKPQAR